MNKALIGGVIGFILGVILSLLWSHYYYFSIKGDKCFPVEVGNNLLYEKEDNYTVTYISEDICRYDTDCSTPLEYLAMSSCPFTSKCIENKCAVICPYPHMQSYNYSYEITEVLDINCENKEDCELPFDYAIKSNCPYEMGCVENKCNVLCPTIIE